MTTTIIAVPLVHRKGGTVSSVLQSLQPLQAVTWEQMQPIAPRAPITARRYMRSVLIGMRTTPAADLLPAALATAPSPPPAATSSAATRRDVETAEVGARGEGD